MRRALVALIRTYRRWLSGRGPLARVRCSFAGDESCSAFGLRAATTAPSAWHAVGQIRRRLARCRNVSVYALPVDARSRVLGWGADHDRALDELCAELARDRELPAAQARVLAARALVARWRSDAAELRDVDERRRALPALQVELRGEPPRPRLRVARLAMLGVLVAALAATAPIAAGAVGTVVALTTWRSGRARRALRRRLRAQRQAASLRGALPVLGAAR